LGAASERKLPLFVTGLKENAAQAQTLAFISQHQKVKVHRSKLTVQIPATPENREALDALRNWNRVIPTLFFLDNCVVSRIKRAVDRGTPITRSVADVDLPQNGVSYLPALMEKASNLDKPFTEDELIGQGRSRAASERGTGP